PPAYAPPGSAVSSMTKCTRSLESATIPGRACITSRWEAPSTIPVFRYCRRTNFNLETEGGASAVDHWDIALRLPVPSCFRFDADARVGLYHRNFDAYTNHDRRGHYP